MKRLFLALWIVMLMVGSGWCANNFSADANCVAVWNFEASPPVTDSLGIQTNLSTGGSFTRSNTHYKVGSYAGLAATNGYAYIADASLTTTPMFPFQSTDTTQHGTFVGWVYFVTDPVSSTCTLVSKYNTTGNARSFVIGAVNTSGKLYITCGTGTSSESWIMDEVVILTGRWYHIGVVFNGKDPNNSNKATATCVVWDDTAQTELINTSHNFTVAQTIANAAWQINGQNGGGTQAGNVYYDEWAVFNDLKTVTDIQNMRSGTYLDVPIVSTDSISSLKITSPYDTATANGTISSIAATSCGFYVSSVNNPPTASDTVVTSTLPGGGLGAYTGDLTSLSSSTKYYVRSWATNAAGTGLGSTLTVWTHPTTYYFDATAGGNDSTGVPNDSSHPYKTLAKLNLILADSNVGDADFFKFKRDSQPLGVNSTQVFRGNLIPLVGGNRATITITDWGVGTYPPVFDRVETPYTQTVGAGGWTDAGGGIYTIAETTAAGFHFYEDFTMLPPATDATLTTGGRWFLDDPNNLLYYKPLTGTPANHILEKDQGTNRGSIYLWTDNHVRYITASNLLFTGIDSRVYLYGNGTDTLISAIVSGCTFKNGAAIYVTPGGQHGITISNNTSTNSFQNWLTFQSSNDDVFDGVTISNNTVTAHNYYPGTTTVISGLASDPDIFYIQNMKNGLIEGNELSGFCGTGNLTMAINHWISGLVPEPCDGNICRNNYIHDVSNGIMWDEGNNTTSNHADIYNNILVNIGLGGTSGYGITGLSYQKTTNPSTIYNNTIYNSVIGICLRQADYWYVKNNIVHTASSYYAAVESETNAHNSWDYNDYYDASSGNVMFYGGAQSFATWRAAGRDVNGVTNDPAFLNGSHGYTLTTDFKPTANLKGTNLSALFTTDFGGVVRRWNMGAWDGPTSNASGGGLSLGLGVSDGNFNPNKKSP